MAAVSSQASSEFFDSRYAAEQGRVDRNRPFSPELESEFAASRLLESRTLIQAGCGLALLIALSRTAVQARAGLAHGVLLVELTSILMASVILVWLAWGPQFERWYLPYAEIVLPVRNAIAAAHFAGGAATGRIELLMILPMLFIGPFFFSGLRYRTAVISCVMALGAFFACAWVAMPHPTAARCSVFLLVAFVGSAFAAHHFEKGARTAFLERYLIAALAQRDALTGASNRRSFDEQLARLWERASEAGLSVAILLIDVDHFKAYNDRYGHLAGDDALRRVARAVQEYARRSDDVFARYGGEEFVAVLQDVNVERARSIGEQMRRAVMELGIEHRGSPTAGLVTISIGIAVIEPNLDRNCRGALQLADQALYQAKVKGRNAIALKDNAEYRLLVTGIFAADVARMFREDDAIAPRGTDNGIRRRSAG